MFKTKNAIITAFSVLVLLLVIYTIFLFTKKPSTKVADLQPSPTIVISKIDSSTVEVVTTLIPNESNTSPSPPESLGGDINIPDYMVAAGTDREKLINNSPVKTEDFTVAFDYSNLLFKVNFTNPEKTENTTIFYEWKEFNYPNLGSDEFDFIN